MNLQKFQSTRQSERAKPQKHNQSKQLKTEKITSFGIAYIRYEAELDNVKTMMAETKEKQEKDDTMKTIKEDVLSLTKKLTEMNKNQVEIKEELSDLRKNVDRKTLDTIKKLDSTITKQNAWMVMNIDESKKATREVDVKHCELNNHNMDVMKREMSKLNIIQKTLWENLMKNKDFPTGQILCFGASKSNPSKDN